MFSEAVRRADEDIDLARATLYISGEEYPGLDIGRYLSMLDSLAEDAGRHIGGAQQLRATVQRLGEYLSAEQGFAGNGADYYDPRNSYLNEVLDRKRGIPITLALVYKEVAKRLGLVFEGIGLPGHFVIRAGPPDQELYIDPFNGGHLMSRSDCERTVQDLFHGSVEFQEEFLRPYTKKQLLIRLLTNLKQNYMRMEDYERAIFAADYIAMIDPSLGSNLKDRAWLNYTLKRYRGTLSDLEAYLKAFPQAQDAEQVRQQIQFIWATLLTIN